MSSRKKINKKKNSIQEEIKNQNQIIKKESLNSYQDLIINFEQKKEFLESKFRNAPQRKYFIEIKIEEEIGSLLRIFSLFNRLNISIESMTTTSFFAKKTIRSIILVILANDYEIEHYCNQLKKITSILQINSFNNIPIIERELLLIKVKINIQNRDQLIDILKPFQIKIVDINPSFLIIEFSGDSGNIQMMELMLDQLKNEIPTFQLVDLTRTGKTVISRASGFDSNYIFEKGIIQPLILESSNKVKD
ncbi:MAG: acetolactate synthase small subunit [Alphaproteobacteria bacterium]|nr:acetolactate synthase small subunit [Alphaproteobacteria bacterium]